MNGRKICLLALLGSLGGSCAGVEEDFDGDSGDYFVSRELQLRWMQDVDSSGRPILSFRRKSDLPTVLNPQLEFRFQPPLAVPGGVLCARGGSLVYLQASTGEEVWSYPVSTGDWLQVSLQRDSIAVYEGAGELVVLNLEGEKLGSFEVMSDALLDSDGEQVYLLSREGIQACSVADRTVLWTVNSSPKMRFHSLLTSDRKVAVGYYGHSIRQQEVALLDRDTGSIRHRFTGKGIGWSENSFFTLQEEKKEFWRWSDSSGAFLRKYEGNAYVEGDLLCYKGGIIYSQENRYYSPGVTHLGRGGRSNDYKRTVVRRELQREGHWQIPYRGRVTLLQTILLDIDSRGVMGWDVSTGKHLFEIQMEDPPRRVALGEKHLFVLSRSGRLQAFEIRE